LYAVFLLRRKDCAKGAVLDTDFATTAATGVNGRWFVAINAQEGFEFATLGGYTLSASLAAFIIDTGRHNST
jgi:hypothetical protein